MFRNSQLHWIILYLFHLITIIIAQSTNATCLSTYNWLNNSKNQNPCLVSAYLQQVCTPGIASFTPALSQHNATYAGPSRAQASVCACSSITYSVLSACAFCQGSEILLWSKWIKHCPRNTTSNGKYPHAVPSEIIVPSWAYSIISNRIDRWDPTNALAIVDNIPPKTSVTNESNQTHTPSSMIPNSTSESSSSTLPTSSSVAFSSISSSLPFNTRSPTPSTTSALNQNDNRKPDRRRPLIGIIIGSVLGGIIVIVLLAIATYYVYRRYHCRPRRSSLPPVLSPTPPPMASVLDESFILSSFSPVSAASYKPNVPLVLVYNPEDPSTYPEPNFQPISHRGTARYV